MFCLYCGTERDTNKKMVAHRSSCEQNPNSVVSKLKDKKEFLSTYTTLQNSVKSYDDIFKVIEDFIATKGYTIEWEKKPSTFVGDVQENFYGNNPLIKAKDKRYAGWKGSFKGKITPIKDFKNRDGNRCSFWDLNGDMSGRYGFKFLRTSSGTWSENFNGDGYLLINDFPALHKEYLGKAKTAQVEVDFNEAVGTIFSEVRNKEREVLSSDKMLISIDTIEKKYQVVREKIMSLKNRHRKNLTLNFKAKTKVTLPTIENPFIDMSEYNKLKASFTSDATVELESEAIKNAISDMEDVYSDLLKFQEAHAEHFI